MTTHDDLVLLNQRLDADAARLRRLRTYLAGEQPLAFLSPSDSVKLDGRITKLAVNVPRLMVRSVADRLAVTGFLSGDAVDPDAALWRAWRRNRMVRRSGQAIWDALSFGRSYLMVGPGAGGARISVESPASVICRHDPATGDVVSAIKRWVSDDDTEAFATVLERDVITRYRAQGNSFAADSVPVSAWTVLERVDNPLGVVPVVPLVNGSRIDDTAGVSVFEDLLGLTDALNKTLIDAMVTSESYARPHRWATGLQIATADDGSAAEMFDGGDDFLLSEDTETKFGQFEAADLQGYGALAAVLVGQIGAVSGLPAHLVGGSTSTPPSAESLQVALDSLTGRVKGSQVSYGDSFGRAMAIADAVDHGGEVDDRLIETLWASVEPRSLAASADAASKLLAAGVDASTVLDRTLGWAGVAVTKENAA